ncbi:MAG: ATP-binding cassette domain-containing protein, partial [Gemmatimonadetes bacterium]|nr:ATP-binding cassette domain-containing protein [Gemmatimonadota bacterium]
TRGIVEFDDPDISISLVFQRPDDQIVGSTVERDLAFGLENQGLAPAAIRERVAEGLAWSGLAAVAAHPPHLLSEGQKQRLALTAALIVRPRVLLLDEPTSRLDPPGRRRFLDAVHRAREEAGTTVVHVTHRSEEVLPADRVIGLSAGTLRFDGTPDDLLASDAADTLGILWSGLHRFQRALGRSTPGDDAASRPARDWNDPAPFLAEAP